ncbi:response regulator [Janthinobacterium sp. SUN137]|uniref:response regulator n=1 Tax=Janthinobacterium sp. SUN137 TaxID=3014789 RepID=UPI002712874E|nr:response regulator [Janthinobacterium sp. SUN137]MDO8040377.1 response regulator [Janthinobacterium sp. SUN137]
MTINILIVEDSDAKLESIRTLLEREISGLSIDFCYSVKSAINKLECTYPDLIVADMSLPTFDIERKERGGTPRPFGGIEVFEHLDRFDLPVPVIVVTSYPSLGDGEDALNLDQLRKRLRKEFPLNYIGAVYFDSAYSKWEEDFINLIHQSISKK